MTSPTTTTDNSPATTLGFPVAEHPAPLDELLGDPFASDNPTGYEAALAADDRGEPFAAGEVVLDRAGLGAEYVPAGLGGRLTGVDTLVRRLRPVFRLDAGLGLGHGLTTLMAALNVWTAGDTAQRARVARLLLDGRRLSVAYHELEHGNDLTGNHLRADPAPQGFTLHGLKRVINNTDRAAGAVVFARTTPWASRPTGRDHSLILLDDLTALPDDTFRRLPRLRTSGLAGCRLGGFEFDGCPVPADALLGGLGEGSSVALRSFQVSRCVTAGAGTALLEAALFGVHRFATERVLYGRPVSALPHARSLLAGAFADLQVAGALARAAARALHLHPAAAGRYAATAKYLVPRLVEDALTDLAVLLGARSYLREGEYAFVGKHLRDIAGLSIGHAGGVSCQLTVLPELPGLRLTGPPADPALFDDSPTPPLDPAALRLRGSREDPLLTVLAHALDDADPHPGLAPLATGLRAELDAVRAESAALPPAARGVAADHRALALTERYAWLLAAAACVGTATRTGPTGGTPDPRWLRAVLERIGRRSGRLPEPRDIAPLDALYGELEHRVATGVSLDIDPEPVARRPA
ncbi:acyl-CoA dehydrogenase [Streptomyces sp. OF3]|uniref:Acyl-CoA dehydrogenase n=1 Tax=Streptomyces alkaliterrae TaxID=2213162 RepID=A0A7W3WIS2_9ACTN|nr:acyl-CoA dehydrogenase [Streptomyces alkaliterrae]MBB1253129.1 acyl-CoA dehydrogenase [Streptomyces alkaliterrae]